MFQIRMEMKGDIDIDSFTVDVECPRCLFFNPISVKQARLRDVAICRGCKSNIQLDDGMNSVRKSRRDMQRQFQALQDKINRAFG